jgi:hypothetical protein
MLYVGHIQFSVYYTVYRNAGHEYGNIEDIIGVVENQQKGSYLNMAEKCHIYITE